MFVSAVLLLFLVKQRWRKGGASSLRWSISNRSLINILYSELQFGCQAPVELLIESCVTWSIWPSGAQDGDALERQIRVFLAEKY